MRNFREWMFHFLILTSLLVNNTTYAQDNDKWNFDGLGYTRGSGFVIRPELYSGLFATIGYQFNPYVQISGGFGFGLDSYGGSIISLGVRTYTSDANWAAIFDYHLGLVNIQGLYLTRHTIIGGASYKDFDFGAGLMYITDGHDSSIGLTITLGYNIRCYRHR
jgi:hypothetical protein